MILLRKIFSFAFQIIGLITFLAGVLNLFISFTDKWIMIGGLLCYWIGRLIEIGVESIEDDPKPKVVIKTEPKGFSSRLEAALKEQKRVAEERKLASDGK